MLLWLPHAVCAACVLCRTGCARVLHSCLGWMALCGVACWWVCAFRGGLGGLLSMRTACGLYGGTLDGCVGIRALTTGLAAWLAAWFAWHRRASQCIAPMSLGPPKTGCLLCACCGFARGVESIGWAISLGCSSSGNAWGHAMSYPVGGARSNLLQL